ncbi:MAG: 6-bladed beta-propeller [Bacteroidales bacterium]|jgi:hypothetical protein
MKRAFHFTALLLLSLTAVETIPAQTNNARNKRTPISIDVVAGIKTQVKMKLSDFADSIVYIPLQGLPDFPIGWVVNLEMTPDELFVLASHEIGLLRFNLAGKLKNRIGGIGNGPGELSMGSDFSLSPEEKRIYFHRNFTHNELCFSYDGKFIEDIKPDKSKLSERTIMLSPNRILKIGAKRPPPEVIPPGNYEALLLDRKGTEIQKILSPLANTTEWRSQPFANKISFTGERSEVWYKNKYLFDAYASDTLFEASPEGMAARYFLNKGKYAGPKWLQGLFSSRTKSLSGDYIVNQPVFESDDYLLFRARLQSICYLVRVNKKDNTTGSLKAANIPDNAPYPSMLKIPNDLDGGISFYPQFTNREGNIWICTVTALDYREEMKELAKKGKIDLSKKSNRSVALYNQLKEEDNPVIVLVYLKRKK